MITVTVVLPKGGQLGDLVTRIGISAGCGLVPETGRPPDRGRPAATARSSPRGGIGAVDLLAETARVRLGEDSTWEGIESLKRMRKKT